MLNISFALSVDSIDCSTFFVHTYILTPEKTLSFALFGFGIFAAGMGFSRDFILYLSMMLLYGIALTMVQTAITTMLQEKADAKMQGRVFGMLGTVYAGFLPMGMATFGPLADILPLQWLVIGSGFALIIIAGIIHFKRPFRTG